MFRAFRDSALTRLSKGQARSVKNAALAARASAVFPSDNQRRRVGPERAVELGFEAEVEVTLLFSLRENAIAKEPGLG